MTQQEKAKLIVKVDEALNTVRPHLKVDEGDVEVVDITEDMIVHVKWLGNCESCAMSIMTMRAGVEEAIIRKHPQIKGVKAINGIHLPMNELT